MSFKVHNPEFLRERIKETSSPQEILKEFVQIIQEGGGFSAKVAVDGLAAVGKGTLTQLLQKEFGIEVISSGHFYRVLTWMYLSFNEEFDKNMSMEEKISQLVEGLEVHIQDNLIYVKHPFLSRPPGTSGLSNTEGVQLEENNIRTPDINSLIAEIAEYKVSQDFVDDQQRLWMGQVKSGILEGRQAWAVFKEQAENGEITLVYMFASQKELESREIRREASKQGRELTPEEEATVIQRLKERNDKDLSREHNPPLSPEDAEKSGYYSFLLDTTELNEHQVALLFLLHLYKDELVLQNALIQVIAA